MNLPEGVEIITTSNPLDWKKRHRVRISIGNKAFLSPVFSDLNSAKDAAMIQDWHKREVSPFLREREAKATNACGPACGQKPARKFDFTI